MILRNDAGEIRLIWIVLLVLISPTVINIVMATIPFIYCIINGINDPIGQLERSVEQPDWIGVLYLFVSASKFLLITWFMIVRLEKRPFSLKEIGLDWRNGSALYIVVGALLGISLKSILLFSLNNFSLIHFGSITHLLLLIISIVPSAFAEEMLFRVYLQRRMIDQIGVLKGILLTSLLFIGFHFINRTPNVSQAFTFFYALTGDFIIGYLYYRTRSLYFTGSIHAAMNIVAKLI